MRFLFVHQNFPGQFVHLLRRLVAEGSHDIVFISEDNANRMDGVRRLLYRVPDSFGERTFPVAWDFERATIRGHAVASVAAEVKRLGFTPDIVIGHHGWGELLDVHDVWPSVPLLGYQEFFYRLDGLDVGFDPEFPSVVAYHPRIRAKNAVNLMTLHNGGHGQTPTEFQRSTYPAWSQNSIHLLREGVDLTLCRPDPASRRRVFRLGALSVSPRERLVTYVARDLEPYRGFHVLMRAIPRLLRERRDVRVVMVGGDGVSYGARLSEGTWRDFMLRELGDAIDPARVHFVGKLDYGDYRRLLQRSDAHVYLTYPFVLSWSFREALATGCPIVASDVAPVREFMRDGDTGLLVRFPDPEALATRILDLLADRDLARRLSHAARAYAEARLDMEDYLDRYQALIEDVVAG